MTRDPIVDETRKAGAELVARAGNDLHAFCAFLRKQQKRHGPKLVRREPARR